MTFLPIVERELRVAARKKGTYLTRVGVGMGAMVLGGIAGLVALYNPPVRFGTLYFQTLSGLAMLYCLGAGRFLTADCLSVEKREETMGLLFLTDLKGYDVVLGKMAATSLNGLYALLAVLPVLAITLVTGGITYGEFWRVALVLLDTFLFSLAVGIFASALTREFRSAMALNFYVLLGLAGLLPAVAGLLLFFHPSSAPAEGLFLPCPVYTLVLAFDALYKSEAAQFWSSAAFILAMSWLLLALACQMAPRSWQAKPAAREKKGSQREKLFRERLLDQNAYYWLAARPWWKARLVWAVIGLALCWLGIMVFSVGWLDESICLVVAFTLNVALKFWITLEAGQRTAEDAKSGAFELLLSTPLAARDFVHGQMLALRRQFLKPLVVAAGLEFFFMFALLTAPAHLRSFTPGLVFWLWMAGIVMLAADAATLSVVAMAAGLTEKNQTTALLKTVRLVLVLPWALWAGLAAVERAWSFLTDDRIPGWGFDLVCWFEIGLGLDLLIGWRTWRRLTGSFRELALRRFESAPPPAGARARCAAMGRVIRDNVRRHPRNRKWAVRLATVLVIGAAAGVWESNRSHDPPPEVVLTGPADGTPLQAVAAGQGVFLILPDGSLWRWGLTEGTNRAVLPERVGTNRDWRTVSVNGNQRLGVRRDGTLWEWQGNGTPTQVGADKDWVEAASSATAPYRAARKKDGTLWAWGDVALRGTLLPSPPVWIPAPAATNHFWKATEDFGLPRAAPLAAGTNLFGNAAGSPGAAPIPAPVTIRRGRGLPPGTILRARGGLGFYNLAVDADGTLWVWGTVTVASGNGSGPATYSANSYPDPIQVCRETNWVGFTLEMPQNNQGQLWNLFAAPPNPAESIKAIGNVFRTQTPVQVGTNRDWMAVEARGNLLLGLRTDSTLWSWGDRPVSTGGPFGALKSFSIPLPTQICSETDWTGFDRTFGTPLARNKSGELWIPMSGINTAAVPNAATSISLTGSLFAHNSPSNQPAPPLQPFGAGPSHYEAHPDGTLWVRPIESGGLARDRLMREAQLAGPYFTAMQGLAGARLIGEARRADPRTDWLAVASTWNATFGLTADGTLWTWGWNLGEKPRVETRSRIETARLRAAAALGMRSPGQRMPTSAPPTYPVQQKPRALMRLAPEKGN